MRISDWSSDVCSSDLFFDEDIDAARWIFNTTLLDADLGVARQFDTYRTDDVDVPVDQDQRTYTFGSLAWDWAARQRIGFRVVHANDDNHLPAEGEPVEPGERNSNGQQTWVNVHQIGRANVRTPVTNAHLVCRIP